MLPSNGSRAATPPLVLVEELTRHFEHGAVRALDGVSFTVHAGETLAVCGPSGCGKSTLLSLLGLLDRPTSGRVVVAGYDLARVAHAARFRARQIGFVFQAHCLISTMTLVENVEAPLMADGVAPRERRLRAMALLDAMALAHRAAFLPARVSGGERQRAAVARALVNAPTLVLADEPTGNLDTPQGDAVADLLLAHAGRVGAGVVLATHNPDLAARATRTLWLRDGRPDPLRMTALPTPHGGPR